MNLTVEGLISQVMPYALSTGLFVSTCDIQSFAGFFDDAGAPAIGRGGEPYTPVDGLQGIPCMSAPMSVAGIGAGQTKMVSEILSSQTRHVLLGGFFPQIPLQDNSWRAVINSFDSVGNLVDSTTWNITGAESDSQSTQTRLALKIVQS